MSTDSGFGVVRLFDDFNCTTLNSLLWTAASNNSGTAFAISAAVNGTMRGTVTSNSGNDSSTVYGSLNYHADDGGPLIFEARVAIQTALTVNVFFGLSDQAAEEIPISIQSGTVTTTATDAAGFYYAGGESTPVWRCGGVAADVDSTQTAASAVHNPVVATFQTLRVVLDADGKGSFYINGVAIAENVSGCVTKTVALMPFFCISDDGAAGSLDVDYCYVSGGRS
jgi:hypothetical protein